jgi:3-oxoisoapionate decarboxylase
MKLGLDSYSYHLAFGRHPDFCPRQKMTLPDFIDRVADLGLDGFQIDPMHLLYKDDSYLRTIVRQTERKNLFIEYGAMSLQPDQLSAELEICAKLGSPVLRTFAGFDRYAKGTSIADEIKKAVRGLDQVKARAEALGIKIAVENHGDFNADELVSVFKTVDSPWVGICLDLGNAMLTFEDPIQACKKMAPFAMTTHFKDHGVTLTNAGCVVYGTALGDGVIDLHAALDLLRATTQLDRIILEIPCQAGPDEKTSLEKEDDMIRRSVAYARDVLKIVEAAQVDDSAVADLLAEHPESQERDTRGSFGWIS